MPVTVTLEQDEALILFELLASEKLEAKVDKPERNALWALEAVLEKQLAEYRVVEVKHFVFDFTQ